MQKVSILCVGKLKEKFYRDAVEEYSKRLQRFCKLEITELPETRLPDEPSPAQIAQGLAKEAELIRAKIPKGAWFCVLTPEGKLTAPAFDGWQQAADFVPVEADGSKRLPAKAHETWEPVLPPERTRTICVLGATAFGQPIRQAAHRPAIYARLAGAPWSAVITPEMAARVICAEGLCDIVYVNQVNDPEVSPPWAEAFVRASSVPVVAGSLQARRWRRLS